jgi:hypothetical protein
MKTSAEKSSSSSSAAVRQSQQPLFKKGGATTFFASEGIQTKLTVNSPGDQHEKDADRTADQIMRMAAPTSLKEEPSIQRKENKEENQVSRSTNEEKDLHKIQRKESGEKDEIQRKENPEKEGPKVQIGCSDCVEKERRQPDGIVKRMESGSISGGFSAPAIVGKVVSGNGSPLDGSSKTFMESLFGADFSNVRVHTDSQAAASARAVSAHAYTYKEHIVFDKGQYNPHTNSGKHLLAHELTHVLQQNNHIRRRVNQDTQARLHTETETPPAEQTALPVAGTSPAEQPLQSVVPPVLVPTAGDETGAPPSSFPSRAGAALSPEPLMPPPPGALSPAAQQRLLNAQSNTGHASQIAADLPSAAENTAAARGAVTEPAEETEARASGALAAELGNRPAPSAAILELCANIRQVIREHRPPDENALLRTDPEASANQAGNRLSQNVSADTNRVGQEYNQLSQDPSGAPQQTGTPSETPPEAVATPPLNAAQATPDAVEHAGVSLAADVTNTQASMDAAGMNSDTAQLVQNGPIAEARAAQGELSQTAQTSPAQVLAQQDVALGTARNDMESLQAQALQALQQSRSGAVQAASAQQTSMVGTEEQKRAELGRQAEAIFTDAQTKVSALLEPLTGTAMQMWDAGKERLATEFRQHLARVQGWVDERHSGIGGAIVGAWDAITGLPSWVTLEYDKAERTFGDGVCNLITEISTHVNGVIQTCETLIDSANQQIETLFNNAPAELRDWAAGEQERFHSRLDGVRNTIQTAQQNFNRDLAGRAAQAVQEVRQEVHALRETARGLIGRVARAIGIFLADPIRFIINGLLSLAGIDPSRFWALINRIQRVISHIVEDPMRIANNLLSAIGQGFQLFFDNIWGHLQRGLFDWLFSSLGSVGVQIPRDLSLRSTITFFLQLMGLSWQTIRRFVARHVGERNIAMIEQVFEVISVFVRQGPAGLFEMLREHFNPVELLETVKQAAIEYIRNAVITQVARRIVMMLNPVGAVLQAVEAIYRVIRWLFENAARIFTLIETVVNGVANLIAGNVAGMANSVEQALGRLVAPVIDFLAGFLGLGDLPERIANVIRGLQARVEAVLDRVIGGVVRTVTRLGGRIMSGVRNAIRRWFQVEKNFKAEDGHQHTLSFSGQGPNAALTIASNNPGPYQTWIQGIVVEGNTQAAQNRRAQKQRAIQLAKQIDGIKQQSAAGEEAEREKAETMRLKMDELSELSGPLFTNNRPVCSSEGNGLVFGTLHNGLYGSSMTIEQLTNNRMPEGSAPNVSGNQSFNIINRRRNQRGSYYILGHLLNHNLGGTGYEWKNLTPLTRQANSEHERIAEARVKTAVNAGNIVFYKVTAQYGRSVPTSTEPAIQEIMQEEQYVPTRLVCEAHMINPVNNNARTNLVPAGTTINNAIDQNPESYDLIGIRREPIILYNCNVNQIASIEGVDKTLAEKIVSALVEKQNLDETRFPSFSALANYTFENGDKFTRQQKAIINSFTDPNGYVYLFRR